MSAASKEATSLAESAFQERLYAVSRRILADEKLEGILVSLDLYPRERKEKGPKEALGIMRKSMLMEASGTNSFLLSYQGADPSSVQKVVASLAALYTEETVKSEQHLDAQIKEAETSFEAKGSQLRNFNTHLSSKQLQQRAELYNDLKRLLDQLQTNVELINRLTEEKLNKERVLAVKQDPVPEDTSPSSSNGVKVPGGNLDSQISNLNRRLDAAKAEQADLRKRIVVYQSRIDLLPKSEQLQNQMTDEYEATRQQYQALVAQKNTEQSNGAEGNWRFRIEMPATYPQSPTHPRRLVWILSGIVFGTVAGLASSFLRKRQESWRDEAERLSQLTGLPVLASIPAINVKTRANETIKNGPKPEERFS